MNAGRKPQPTALKLLRGIPASNHDEPMPEVAIPDCPDHLDDAARAEWDRLVPELASLGMLTRIDRAALAAYCQAWSRWEHAERQVQEMGLIVKSPNGYPCQNPYLSIANKAVSQVKTFAAELGLTPSSRSKVKVKPRPTSGEPRKDQQAS